MSNNNDHSLVLLFLFSIYFPSVSHAMIRSKNLTTNIKMQKQNESLIHGKQKTFLEVLGPPAPVILVIDFS